MASACAVVTVLRGQSGLLRNFFWPHRYDSLIVFGAVFLPVLIVLLAYYHLGRLGAIVMLFVGFAAYYGMAVCAIYTFAGGVQIGVFGYSAVLALSSALIYLLHTSATTSRTIEDAQRGLGLRKRLAATLNE